MARSCCMELMQITLLNHSLSPNSERLSGGIGCPFQLASHLGQLSRRVKSIGFLGATITSPKSNRLALQKKKPCSCLCAASLNDQPLHLTKGSSSRSNLTSLSPWPIVIYAPPPSSSSLTTVVSR
jgi:hypothetical protein